MAQTRYRDAKVGGCVQADVQTAADGSIYLRSTQALQAYPQRMTDCLERWAQEAPDRVFAARRQPGAGAWDTITYAQMLDRAKRVGQSLVDMGLGVDKPVAILSGNDLEHLTLALGAMWAGVPHVPVSTAYSLVSQDFGKLRHILAVTTPGLVLASDAAYARAIAATVPAGTVVVTGDAHAHSLRAALEPGLSGAAAAVQDAVRPFSSLLNTEPATSGDQAHAAIGPDTIVKFLFTSGSTKAPKGVITTHRMICSNQQMIRQCLGFFTDEPPVLVDWLPWNHVFGGSHNVGITLYNGGTLYIDDGKPTPTGIAETLRNLREISPTIYFNVPTGLEQIAAAMDTDTLLRDTLFKRCKAMMFAGAALSQAVWDKLHAHAEAAVGERVRIITGLGMTETAPSCTFAVGTDVASGHIGLPIPGVEIKLVPNDGKTEIRFRGPNVMPGYWRGPEQTAEAFDEEGFYCTGDAVRWIDPQDPQRGLLFDGRTAEDFKLSTGTFVSVGPLRARIVAAGDPCIQDAVITGLNRNEVGALVIPRADECRRLAGLPADTPLPEVLHHASVRAFFQQVVNQLWQQATGSATRVARLHVLAEPPSIDKGEVTDKGSINQRAVLAQRSALVEALYAGQAADPFVILPDKASGASA